MIPSHSSQTSRATVDVVLVRRSDGVADLLPDGSASCRTCGMCGIAARQSESRPDGTAFRLSLPVRSLILLAAGVYGLPLFGLLAGALTATAFAAGDAAALAGALAGGAIAVFGMRRGARMLEQSALTQLSFQTIRDETAENTDTL